MKHIVSENNFVECKECGRYFQKIDGQHLSKDHPEINIEDYQKKYPGEPTMSKKEFERIEKIKNKFKLEFNQKLNDYGLELEDEYINANYKHRWKCKNCNNVFEQSWFHISQGSTCTKCRFKGNRDTKTRVPHNIQNVPFVTCPKCNQNFDFLHPSHLKSCKTSLEEIRREYPNLPTMTKEESEKRSKRAIDCSDKKMETNKKLYDGTGFSSNILREETKKTIKNKYGSENIMITDEGKTLFKNSMEKKYGIGIDNPLKINSVAEKVSEKMKGKESKLKDRTYIEIHGEEKAKILKEEKSKYFIDVFRPAFSAYLKSFSLEFLDEKYTGANKIHNFKCKICNTVMKKSWWSIQQGYNCPICNPKHEAPKKEEKEFLKFIQETIDDKKIIILENDRTIIKPKELDIYIPNLNIAFEYNELYWHSTWINEDSKYHFNKIDGCLKNNIRLFMIWQDLWLTKQDIIKARIKHILHKASYKHLNPRDCIIQEIDSESKNLFLEKYHLQGKDISSIRLGCFYNKELISVMTFTKPNPSKGGTKNLENNIWELNRFCTNYNYHIPGISGSLLSYFKQNFDWKMIYTYADRAWSNGNLYEKLGFIRKNTSLGYWFTDGIMRYSKWSLKREENEPIDIPLWKLRREQGYERIWNSGNIRFELINEKTSL